MVKRCRVDNLTRLCLTTITESRVPRGITPAHDDDEIGTRNMSTTTASVQFVKVDLQDGNTRAGIAA